ncbi:hypothetical protein HZC33_01340 [Candidatus Wolfebacteria bacterium]|nr:hypothetical protein [Candidatus Wolfebacteria bacterium]
MKTNFQKGYIALTSAVIISALIMIIALTLSSGSFSGRFDILGVEFKKISRALAEACAETALLKLAQNSSYSGDENIQIGDKQCSILAIESAGGQKIIKTKANFQNFITNLKIAVSISNLAVVYWEEVANF